MESKSEFARKLCEKIGIPYKEGKGYATLDGVPINTSYYLSVFLKENFEKSITFSSAEIVLNQSFNQYYAIGSNAIKAA